MTIVARCITLPISHTAVDDDSGDCEEDEEASPSGGFRNKVDSKKIADVDLNSLFCVLFSDNVGILIKMVFNSCKTLISCLHKHRLRVPAQGSRSLVLTLYVPLCTIDTKASIAWGVSETHHAKYFNSIGCPHMPISYVLK